VVINSDNEVLYREVIKTLTRAKEEKDNILRKIDADFNVEHTCATGYGREHFEKADFTKTEIYCASEGVTSLFPEEKTIVDIGGEDIKVLTSEAEGKVSDFYLNTKCAAGTGTFITEIAERAEIRLDKMSELASKSGFKNELNSFCTVFAKTEIMKWIFDEVPMEDLAKGIYISIVNRIFRIRMDRTLPLYLIGGVAEYHPFIRNVMEEKFQTKVTIPEYPQYLNALGAALLAKKL